MKHILYIGNQLSGANKTITTIDTLSKLLYATGFNVTTASNKKSKILRLCDMLLCIIANRETSDYILIDTYSTKNFYYAYLCSRLCRFFKLKYIPILHGGNLPKRLKSSPRLSGKVFNKAYINVAPSMYLMHSFKQEGYTNIVYIPNTIELKNYSMKERNFDSISLLWVRSFSRIYNPKLAVYILKSLRDENLNASLCMVGPDNDGSFSEVKTLAKSLNLDVEFTGKLSKEAWHKKAEDFNVFINTTNVDNTPVSVIEAMALGLPVVSTNVGGLPFLIKNNSDGILVKPNNVEEFKNAILKLKNTPLLTRQIVLNARDKAEGYDWEIVKKRWMFILS